MQKADQLRAEIASIGELLKNGSPDRAFKRAIKSAKKWPQAAALPRLAGISAIQQQKFKLAQTHFERAWRLDPANPELMQNYSLSLVQGGDASEALRFFDKISARAPLAPPLQFIRAMALLRERQENKALADIELVLKRQPGNLQAHCLKADILDELRQWDAAIDVLTELVRKHPKFQYGQLRLAKGLVGTGRIDDALRHARAALELAPGHPETLQFMAKLPNLTLEDLSNLKAQVDTALSADIPNREAAAMIQFAASNLARQQKDLPQEMHHLSDAHALLREGYKDWENRSETEARNRLAAPLPAASPDPQTDSPRPIFVVGLPRSGTTLVERILSSHSGIQGMGELAVVHRWARKAEADPSNAPDLAEYYLNSLPDLAEGTVAFVDKAPGNYAFVGAMAQAFPDAVILNVERDPRDVALSMWRTHFGAGGMYYTHDLTWMAAEANRYRRYIQHWQAELPGRIHKIGYEYLVNNLRPAAEELAQLCDLHFEKSMLSPQKAPDAVRTASNLQVRQPVTSASVGSWKAVADDFAPFVQGLDTDLWPDITKEG